MTKPLHATCDQCNYITDVVFHKANHPNGIEETYFTCEHCFYRYTSFVTDSWIRKKQRKAEQLRVMPRKSGKNHLWRLPELIKVQEEINTHMTKLKHNLISFGRADL